MKKILIALLLLSLFSIHAEIIDFILVVDDPSIKFESVEYYSFLTNGYIQLGYLDNAMRDINEGLEKFPESIELILLKGKVYFEKGDIETETEYYTEALERHPDEAELYFARSYCYHDLKMDNEYISDLKSTVEHDSTHALALGNLGLFYLNKKEFSTAEAYLIESVKHDPELNSSLNNLGSLNYQTAQYEKAIEYCNKSLAVQPENILAMYIRGLSKKQNGDVEGGEADIKRAVELNEKNK